MRKEYSNETTVPIDTSDPSVNVSTINVIGHEGKIRDVNVTLDIDHTWTSDLKVFLVSPGGSKEVLLVSREGDDGDNFRGTKFDDSAELSITSAFAPFGGTYRPEESLSKFNDLDPNGTWTLRLEDMASQDGGQLNRWELSIETATAGFRNDTPVPISPGGPNTISSEILVTGLDGLIVEKVAVTLKIDHTWDSDLIISLQNPEGNSVVLVKKQGGDQDGFNETIFTDDANETINQGQAPFNGPFRPEESLSGFKGQTAGGVWTLVIEDTAKQDGGVLHGWSLEIEADKGEPVADSKFFIEVEISGGLTPNQRSVFEIASRFWSQIIVGDIISASLDDGRIIDDILIHASGKFIDGPGRILGQAGPRRLRPGDFLPITGEMTFDSADLAAMEAEGSLLEVIIHEMAHVLGSGTIWQEKGLLRGAGGGNPVFIGPNAMREYQTLIGADEPTPVPVANTGGRGTRDSHWRESVFGNELMTGIHNNGVFNPISRLTIASLEDLGYEVNYDAAQDYALPTPLMLASLGAEDHVICCRCCEMGTPDRIVMPKRALMKK
jgi:subtilisin-like proprotein convertase family protein